MKRRKQITVALLTSVAALAAVLLIRGTSRQRFLRDLDRIQVGMTAIEVERIMAGYMKGIGAKWQPPPGMGAVSSITEVGSGQSLPTAMDSKGELQFTGSITFRHSNAARYDSDWGIVRFQDGRVVDVQFMAD